MRYALPLYPFHPSRFDPSAYLYLLIAVDLLSYLILASQAPTYVSPYLSIGQVRADVQRDEQGKPYVLNSVLKAEDILHKKKLDKEYAPITARLIVSYCLLCSYLG